MATAAETSANQVLSHVTAAGKPRRDGELIAAAKEALRASHSAKSDSQRDQAARQLVDAFVELQSDKSLSIAERQSLYHQVRGRLLAIEQGLRTVVERERASSTSQGSVATKPVADSVSKSAAPASIDVNGRTQILAQQIPPGVPNGVQPPANNTPNAGQQANGDYGQELLDLIQRVIRPSTWDINGGPSSGYYYRPLHALVITAPAEIHGEVGGVLGGLRQ